MHWPAPGLAALLARVLAIAACADKIEHWQPPLALGVSVRTPAVRDAKVCQIGGARSCPEADPDALTRVRQLDLSDRGSRAFQAGDLVGLTPLRELRLNDNALQPSPTGSSRDWRRCAWCICTTNPARPSRSVLPPGLASVMKSDCCICARPRVASRPTRRTSIGLCRCSSYRHATWHRSAKLRE